MNRDTAETRLTVGFRPAVVSSLGLLARQRSTSVPALMRTAVVALLDFSDTTGDIPALTGATTSDIDLIPGLCETESGDYDPLTDVVVYRGIQPQITESVEVPIDADSARRLVDFCDATGLSRARAIRMAVDRYVLTEATTTGTSLAGARDTAD